MLFVERGQVSCVYVLIKLGMQHYKYLRCMHSFLYICSTSEAMCMIYRPWTARIILEL